LTNQTLCGCAFTSAP